MDEAERQERARRTKVVATMGPASLELVKELGEAGADQLRINASHLLPGTLRPMLEKIVAAAPELPVVVDLQGAKMRLGRFDARRVRDGEIIVFTSAPDGVVAGDSDEIPLPHPELFSAVSRGQTLTIDDGRLRLGIESVSPARLETKVLAGGSLLQRKGVNLAEHPVELEDLSESDQAFIEEARDMSNVSFAFSFMLDGREVAWIRRRLPEAQVVAKIERAEAVDAIETISSIADALWICRGDLGEQLGPARLARFVGSMDPARLPVPVLMAGQVLEHLTSHPSPTRSEICHLHDILCRGYAGIVLSDETAIGEDPVNALRTARVLSDSFMPGSSCGARQ